MRLRSTARDNQNHVIIWGETLQKHIDRVNNVMKIIRKSGLKQNKSKYVLVLKASHFLDID